jgi:DNA-binding NarL/FixJ family response regulator
MIMVSRRGKTLVVNMNGVLVEHVKFKKANGKQFWMMSNDDFDLMQKATDSRRKHIVRLFKEGNSPQKIARGLDLDLYTVKVYLNEAFPRKRF